MNVYQNMKRMIEASEPSWADASNKGIVDLAVEYDEPPYLLHQNKRFINMCSCSYLGLDTHPEILEGAIKGIRRSGALHLTTARCRLFLTVLEELETNLSDYFNGYAVAYNSCAAATSACLPLIASGKLTQGKKPVMVFDRHAHFSMNHMKPLCADETQILTSQHNDIEFLESLCQSHGQVAYIADATYSIEGFAPIKELKRLQKKYGLFLYLDDSHGLSITGEKGEGYALEQLGKLNSNTVVVASLAKAFGAAGGMLLSGDSKLKSLLVRYGNAWSQYLNSASIGGAMASLKLHKTKLLKTLQARWLENVNILDRAFNSQNKGQMSPIRVVELPDPTHALDMAKKIFDHGYYTSAVFFPVVPKNKAGLRIMPRADVPYKTMYAFVGTIQKELEKVELAIAPHSREVVLES